MAVGVAVGAGATRVGAAVGSGMAVGVAVGAGATRVGAAVGSGMAVGVAVGAGMAVAWGMAVGAGMAVAVGAATLGSGLAHPTIRTARATKVHFIHSLLVPLVAGETVRQSVSALVGLVLVNDEYRVDDSRNP